MHNPTCVSVRIRNENTGEHHHPEPRSDNDGANGCGWQSRHGLAYRPVNYYQNYFKVVDRDGEDQVDAHDGPYVCDDTVA